MKLTVDASKHLRRKTIEAYTLVEVVVSFLIGSLVISGCFKGYQLSARRAEWSSYSMAAQSNAIKKMEDVVASAWVPQYSVDHITTNLFPTSTERLYLPTQQTNVVLVTNFVSIADLTTTPPVKMIRVDCVWSFLGETYTNSVGCIRAPNL